MKPVKLDTLWFQSKVSNIVECPTFQDLDTWESDCSLHRRPSSRGVRLFKVSNLTGFIVDHLQKNSGEPKQTFFLNPIKNTCICDMQDICDISFSAPDVHLPFWQNMPIDHSKLLVFWSICPFA